VKLAFPRRAEIRLGVKHDQFDGNRLVTLEGFEVLLLGFNVDGFWQELVPAQGGISDEDMRPADDVLADNGLGLLVALFARLDAEFEKDGRNDNPALVDEVMHFFAFHGITLFYVALPRGNVCRMIPEVEAGRCFGAYGGARFRVGRQ